MENEIKKVKVDVLLRFDEKSKQHHIIGWGHDGSILVTPPTCEILKLEISEELYHVMEAARTLQGISNAGLSQEIMQHKQKENKDEAKRIVSS